jgi:D-alanyl-D-alanine carboxypeptidase
MLLTKTLAVTGSLLVAALATPAPTHDAPVGSACKPHVQRAVRSLVRAGAPGSLAVVRTPAGVCHFAFGLGNRRPKTGMRATDRFRIGSLTKTFVATVVLELVGEGRLSLDDSVERWLPGLVPNGGRITVRELLNHTSGLFDFTDDKTWVSRVIANPARDWPPRDLVAVATAHPPMFAPGTGWWYSNTNYILAGLVVEQVTGTTLERQLRQRIFEPLELEATSLPTAREIEGAHAHGYVGFATVPSLKAGTYLDATSLVSPSIAWGAGGIISNAGDVTTFYATLLHGRLLRPDLLTEMKSMVGPGEYGLGLWFLHSRCGAAYGHFGDTPGYRNEVIASPDGRRAVDVMVNVDATFVASARLQAAAEAAFCAR